MKEYCGVINVFKEKGFTSHDVVNIVRKTLNKAKTGHTGTLDPDAEGVLPICVGKATKLADYIMSDVKEYIAELCLGIETTTQDKSGEIISKKNVDFSKDEITEAVMSFKGEIFQLPPMYSAVRVNGKRLYELARSGIQIQREKRAVVIYEIEIIEFLSPVSLKMSVLCSKGTYIRTLCSDIGQKLGCGGFMSELLRTRSGQFSVEKSLRLEEIKKLALEGRFDDFILSPENIFPDIKKIKISSKADKYLLNGNKISTAFIIGGLNAKENEKLFVYDEKSRLIGLYRFGDGFIKPLAMLIN